MLNHQNMVSLQMRGLPKPPGCLNLAGLDTSLVDGLNLSMSYDPYEEQNFLLPITLSGRFHSECSRNKDMLHHTTIFSMSEKTKDTLPSIPMEITSRISGNIPGSLVRNLEKRMQINYLRNLLKDVFLKAAIRENLSLIHSLVSERYRLVA